jgi:hypothetical protein
MRQTAASNATQERGERDQEQQEHFHHCIKRNCVFSCEELSAKETHKTKQN